MPGKDGAEVRRARIEEIGQAVQKVLYQNKETGEIPLNRTVVSLMVITGLTRPKTLEYLSLLNEAGQFDLDLENDKIKKPTA